MGGRKLHGWHWGFHCNARKLSTYKCWEGSKPSGVTYGPTQKGTKARVVNVTWIHGVITRLPVMADQGGSIIIIRKYNGPRAEIKTFAFANKFSSDPWNLSESSIFTELTSKTKKKQQLQSKSLIKITDSFHFFFQETDKSSVQGIGKKHRTHISRSNERCCWTFGNEARVVKQI